jgi:hypothetical protein
MNASIPMHSWPFEGKVSNEWFNRGVWLCQAAEAFGDDDEIAQFRQHVKRFAELRDGVTPEMFEGSSNLSGEARKKLWDRLVFDEEKDAFRLYLTFKERLQITLKNKLYSGSLVACGARGAPDADFTWIPTRAWFYLRLHLDEGNVVRGEGTVYFHVRVVNSRDGIGAPQTQPPGDGQRLAVFKSEMEDAFLVWMRQMDPQAPTIRQCGEWARDKGLGVGRGRKLYSKHITRRVGRPPKQSAAPKPGNARI